ncbi:uncharacterized protein MONBRDRAFT_31954, partial [Monosiga brevicollis MX1]
MSGLRRRGCFPLSHGFAFLLWLGIVATAMLSLAHGAVSDGLSHPTCATCSCYAAATEFYVDCTGVGLTAIPDLPTNATVVTLRRNFIQVVGEGAFDAVPSLRYLHLQSNGLTNMEAGALRGLTLLQALNLADNALGTFALDDLAASAAALTELDLSSNSLSVFDGSVSSHATNLETLILRGNDIVSVTNLASLTHLQHLDLSSNRLTSVSATLVNALPELRQLWLQDNAITRLDTTPFVAQTHLEKLSLASNLLTQLPTSMLAATTALNSLDISENSLTSIGQTLLAGLSQLASLSFANNEIVSFPSLPTSINATWVSGNPFDCCGMESLVGTSYIMDLAEITCNRPQNAAGLKLVEVATPITVCNTTLPDQPPAASVVSIAATTMQAQLHVVHGNAFEPVFYTASYTGPGGAVTNTTCPAGYAPVLYTDRLLPDAPCEYLQRDATTNELVDPILVDLSNLKPYTNYTLTYIAHNELGASLAAPPLSFRTLESVPEAPASISFLGATSRTLNLSVTAPAVANGFELELYTMGGSFVSTLSGDSGHFMASGLEPYTTYSVRARVATAIGSGPWGGNFTFATLEDLPSSSPTILSAQATSSSLNVTWAALSTGTNGIITGYAVYLDGASACVVTNQFWCEVTGLNPGTTHTFQIAAATSLGYGPNSSSYPVQTLPAAPAGMPTPMVSNVTSTTARLQWTTPAQPNGAIIKYIVTVTSPTASNGTIELPGNQIAYELIGLKPHTVYHVAIQPWTLASPGNFSSPIVFTTQEAVSVGVQAPAEVSTTFNGTILHLITPEQPNGAILYFNVYVLEQVQVLDGYEPKVNTTMFLVAQSNSTMVTLGGLAPATRYTLASTAVTSAGESAQSAPIVVQTADS